MAFTQSAPLFSDFHKGRNRTDKPLPESYEVINPSSPGSSRELTDKRMSLWSPGPLPRPQCGRVLLKRVERKSTSSTPTGVRYLRVHIPVSALIPTSRGTSSGSTEVWSRDTEESTPEPQVETGLRVVRAGSRDVPWSSGPFGE